MEELAIKLVLFLVKAIDIGIVILKVIAVVITLAVIVAISEVWRGHSV